ncbi:MAG: YihY/virulence factor BrkB family protein [Prevotella sp.]|nr:YihY/virulence factor BrkB family protein [Prevotella sp.]
MNKLIKKAIRFLQVDIWAIPSQGDYHPRYLLIEILKKLMLAVRFFTAKRVVSHAAALTYSTLLAIVPILAVVFAIARGFGYNKYIEVWFRDAFSSQPQAANVIIDFVNSYLVHTKSGIFLGVGLIFMLYTVLMLVSNVERTFNEIWQVKKQRGPFRMFTDYMAMLFMFPIFIVLASGLSIFMATLADGVADAMLIGPFMRFLIQLFPYVLMSGVFIALYVFMPNTHVKLRFCIVPGILAGVAMQWLQLFYIHSQIWMSSYNAIYGSFAALPLFMLWVQISWTICLFGAELCYTNQNLEYYDYNTQTTDISHRYRMLMSVLLLSKICKRADSEKEPYTALELRELTDIPIRIVNDLLYNMMDAGLLIESTPDDKGAPSRFSLVGNAEKITVGALIDRLEAQGTWKLNVPLNKHYNEQWKKVVKSRLDYLSASREVLLKEL